MSTAKTDNPLQEILESIGETDDSVTSDSIVVELPNEYKAFGGLLGNTKDKPEGLTVYHKTGVGSLDYSGYSGAMLTFGDKSDLISLLFSSCTLEIEGKNFYEGLETEFTDKKITSIRVFNKKKFRKTPDSEPIITDIRWLPPASQWKNDDNE